MLLFLGWVGAKQVRWGNLTTVLFLYSHGIKVKQKW